MFTSCLFVRNCCTLNAVWARELLWGTSHSPEAHKSKECSQSCMMKLLEHLKVKMMAHCVVLIQNVQTLSCNSVNSIVCSFDSPSQVVELCKWFLHNGNAPCLNNRAYSCFFIINSRDRFPTTLHTGPCTSRCCDYFPN